MTFPGELPDELNAIRESALRALGSIRPADSSTIAEDDFLFVAGRTAAGRNLPPYYLVYFLLVNLLGFRNLGQSEKVAWSVPIDYQGQAFLIEHRKLGVGVFAHKPEEEEDSAQDIVNLIRDAVDVAHPYFDWLAD